MAAKVDGALPFHAPEDALNASNIDAEKVAIAWLSQFGKACTASDVDGCLTLIWEDGFWRDLLPLTLSYRSLGGKAGGKDRIRKVLEERLAGAGFKNFELDSALPPRVDNVFPDLSWIMLAFTFEVRLGKGSGIARIIPGKNGGWEACTISTVLEQLHGVNEKLGELRDDTPHSDARPWVDQRAEEVEFKDRDPEVLIVGAAQAGLGVAARLKTIGVSSLCIDRNERIGDIWRNRYASLRLHDPVQYDHMPYIPFPATWPKYTPAKKLADWLESYAHSMELNVWTSSNIISNSFDDKTRRWTFEVERRLPDGTKQLRTLRPKIVVWATGLAGGTPNLPDIEGMDKFKGTIVHSTRHGSGRDYKGKQAVIIGACTSAHDIARDFVDQGAAETTMVQRSPSYIMSVQKGMPLMMSPLYVEGGPPVDIADRINASLPFAVLKELHKRVAAAIKDADKDLLDGLHRVGFRTHQGEDDSGFLMMALARGGGYYLDVGASGYIIDGKIKVRSGRTIQKFTESQVIYDDGSSQPADVVVFATGFGDMRQALRSTFGDKIAQQAKQFWGLNYEREIQGVYTTSGIPSLYMFAGNLAWCRFNSKLLALQIKAQIDGLFVDEDRCEL